MSLSFFNTYMRTVLPDLRYLNEINLPGTHDFGTKVDIIGDIEYTEENAVH